MDNQKLFDLIERASDNSSCLRQPTVKDLVDLIKTAEDPKEIYRDPKVEKNIAALRDSVYSTMSERRTMVNEILRSIVASVCENQGLDLVCRFAGRPYTLHVGIVTAHTHTGLDAVYGIRDCNNDADPVWEYLPVSSNNTLMQTIAWRYRSPLRHSIYGHIDPLEINKLEYN